MHKSMQYSVMTMYAILKTYRHSCNRQGAVLVSHRLMLRACQTRPPRLSASCIQPNIILLCPTLVRATAVGCKPAFAEGTQQLVGASFRKLS